MLPANVILSGVTYTMNMRADGITDISLFCSFVLPWLFAIPMQTGNVMPAFITW